ncbi:pfkB family carbohydrate kinase [Quadrisphaera granulorum]|uniref:PfkB family carbohydrate kinase n=1 Tax=Quadrisphaera granulorum TaxID=317664 RepID=A0A315ZE30_9ACTN|nr:PfkB family carbohydrate kinase [Quadrisphaera granulorum]PWJ43413.1 pfkB family carbohydrate kinase [Quadrisphaera granulorum]SZE99212.1 pfkB family carbohydrate kinase [Quadrisphaera granulorum]
MPTGFVCSREFSLLREYVEVDGLTLKELGRLLGVTEGTASKWCSPTSPWFISAKRAARLTGERGAEIARCIAEAEAKNDPRWKVQPEELPPPSSYEALRERLRRWETEKTFVLSAHNMDYLLEVRAIAGDHEEAVGETLRLPGGSGANTGYALAKLGGTVSFGGIVGDDDDGKDLREDLERHCVGSTKPLVIAPNAPTGRATILSLRDGTCRAIYVQAGVNAHLARALDGEGNPAAALTEAAVQGAGVVHVSSFTGRAEQQMMRGLPRRLSPDQVLSFTPHSHVSELGLDSSPELFARVNVLFVYQGHLDLLVRRSRKVRRGEIVKTCG